MAISPHHAVSTEDTELPRPDAREPAVASAQRLPEVPVDPSQFLYLFGPHSFASFLQDQLENASSLGLRGTDDIPGDTTLEEYLSQFESIVSDDVRTDAYHVYEDAQRLSGGRNNEEAWVNVAWRVLEMNAPGEVGDMILNHDVYTKLDLPVAEEIDPGIDLALSMDPDHRDVGPVVSRYLRSHPGARSGCHDDDCIWGLPVFCGITVRDGHGSEVEAARRLFIWCTREFTKLKSLSNTLSNETIPPLLGWTVVGHSWELYQAWLGPTGDVRLFQLETPSNVTYGTRERRDVFGLLRMLRLCRQWALKVYWPQYTRLVFVSGN